MTENAADDAVTRIRDLNERIIAAGKGAGLRYLDAYERTLSAIAAVQERAGRETDVAWLSALADAQANLVREVTRMYVSAGRDLLK